VVEKNVEVRRRADDVSRNQKRKGRKNRVGVEVEIPMRVRIEGNHGRYCATPFPEGWSSCSGRALPRCTVRVRVGRHLCGREVLGCGPPYVGGVGGSRCRWRRGRRQRTGALPLPSASSVPLRVHKIRARRHPPVCVSVLLMSVRQRWPEPVRRAAAVHQRGVSVPRGTSKAPGAGRSGAGEGDTSA
jgi:hypothetical protein